MLFKYSNQQWFNTDCIEAIDDYGSDLDVTLKGGRKCRVAYSDRDLFFACVSDMRELPAPAADLMMAKVFQQPTWRLVCGRCSKATATICDGSQRLP